MTSYSLLLFFLAFTLPVHGMLDKKKSFQKLLSAIENEKKLIITLTHEKHPAKLREKIKQRKKLLQKQCFPITTCYNGELITFKKKCGRCVHDHLLANFEHIEIIGYLYSILKY